MVFVCAYVLAWVVALMIVGGHWIGNVLALMAAVLVARSVWRADDAVPTSTLGFAGIGAATLGFIGFAAGFFGPMILAPEANQGPMLGIFITGPLGALLGAVGGFLYGLRTRREA